MRAFRAAPQAHLAAFSVLVSIFILWTAAAQAAEVKIGNLVILEAWSRATPVATGAAYITVRNDGAAADRLIGASAAIAKMVDLHTTQKENGVMQMRAVDGIDIPPHATVTLKPGEFHIMLMGLAHPLKAGESFPLALTFAKAGAVTVTVMVKAAGASSDMGDMKDMGGMK